MSWPVYEVGQHNRSPFIAMEYVDDPTLTELLEAGPLAPDKALDLAQQLAKGLQKAHAHGIVHRDLKPDNIMMSSDGVVKILDFGLSKPLSSGKFNEAAKLNASDTNDTCEELTLPGTILGILEYMSPEQASGYRVDFRADQFAFGAILYEVLTGNVAFRRDTAVRVLAAVIEGEPEPIGDHAPEKRRALVERCLRKNPEERFESTDALLAAIVALNTRQRDGLGSASWLAVGGVVLAALAAAVFI